MAYSLEEELMRVGVPGEVAKRLQDAIENGGGSVAWDDVTGKPATFPATVPVASATTATTATSAATLTTGRTFALTGGATGTSAAFNGSANATIAVTLATPAGATRGGVLQQAAIPNVAAAPTQAEHNAILTALRAAGVILP